ncbi:hypothetical protein [Sphingomonas sp. C3-2]|uniref:hypothetical protein n=1 Tax=Sphingomonas sp. C3-2 TaxID=3062169 RepID=UPI00294AA8A7|nr:hypothetical protein [Sphingomonas sp. C3-2]WOK36306.1 hypothetical protein QYC26_15070 [Sphingomonas sp. C3-2]
MFSAVLIALALAAGANPTDAPRKEFSQCMDKFVRKSLDAKMPASSFDKGLAPACAAAENALRQASVNYDVQDGVARPEAEKYINDEISDLQTNVKAMYAQYLETGTKPD